MNSLIRLHVAAATVLGASLALAQGSTGPGASASAPGMGMGTGGGMGPGMVMGTGMGMRSGDGVRPGWSMMTLEERSAHQASMAGMKSTGECNAYRDKHHQQMVERAKQRGQTLPGAAQQDACAGVKK